MADQVDKFPVCYPCEPACPPPSLEGESKTNTCDLYGFERPVYDFGNGGWENQIPVVNRGKKYTTLAVNTTDSGSGSISSTYTDQNDSEQVGYTSYSTSGLLNVTTTSVVDGLCCGDDTQTDTNSGSGSSTTKTWLVEESFNPSAPEGEKYSYNVYLRTQVDYTVSVVAGEFETQERTRVYDPNGLVSDDTSTSPGFSTFNIYAGLAQGIHYNRSGIDYTHTVTSRAETVTVSGINTFTGGGTEVETTTWINLIELQDYIDAGAACVDGEDWFSDSSLKPAVLEVTYTDKVAYPYEITSLTQRKIRYRVTIAEDFNPPPAPAEQKWHGLYGKYKIDETFTPVDHDPQNPELSPIVVTEQELPWTGPGTLGDEDSWATAWQELDIPSAEGETVVTVNSHQCYTGGSWRFPS